MLLFDCVDALPGEVSPITSIVTPLGSVRFEATLDREIVSRAASSETARLKGGGWIASWDQPEFRLELLVCRPTLRANIIENREQPLMDCWAWMWRLEARSPVGPCLFTAEWEEGYTWEDGGSDSGEFLYAKTWDDEEIEVTIGTEDVERLIRRAENGDLPSAWRNAFGTDPLANWQESPYWQNGAHERLGVTGVATPLPTLAMGQRCQIHYAVAWAEADPESVSTWLAVDCFAADILKGAGCT